jgi:hypothetical protein
VLIRVTKTIAELTHNPQGDVEMLSEQAQKPVACNGDEGAVWFFPFILP